MICPLMSKPVAVDEFTPYGKTGYKVGKVEYVDCEKEKCAWWVKLCAIGNKELLKKECCAIKALAEKP